MSKKSLALIFPLTIIATFLITFRIAYQPRRPVYGWKTATSYPVASPVPALARFALAQATKGARVRVAIETEDNGATLALTAATWECVANCDQAP